MTGNRPALEGLLEYLAVAVTPAVLFWAVLRLTPVAGAALEALSRRGPRPAAPALEAAVGHLRRLRREVRGRTHRNRLRRVALLAAYDDTLLEVCALVGVDAPLAGVTGPDRAFARLVTEAALEDAGIALDPAPGGPASGGTAAA